MESREIKLFSSFITKGSRVLEIGCANGIKLESLRQNTKCVGYGIDPSKHAIRDGVQRYPLLNLKVGSANQLEFEDKFFDVVIFGFCLYLLDRDFVMRAVSESDRVLANNGYLMITDFDPVIPFRRPYKHIEGAFTYEMQYPNLWLANPAYSLVEKISFTHFADKFGLDPQERLASWVLYKNTELGYFDVP